jgi:tetratricopeptide (TPR) repeat protein
MGFGHKYFLALLIMFCMSACAGPTLAPADNTLSEKVLLDAQPLLGDTNLAELDDVHVLEMDQRMLAFLDEHVNREHGREDKLRQLLVAIITAGEFGLVYDETTRTAQETFDTRLGNCLSFTNMFVAMARELGINVYFQEIENPPNWSLHGDNYVISRHVNVLVNLGAGDTKQVDFNIDDFQGNHDRQQISDERALAHYYTNVGTEYLQRNMLLEALRYFRKAIATDDEFAPAWSNLGALYSHAGHYDYAEAAYLQALTINPRELVAMSNLGQLHEYLGQVDLANRYNKQSKRHRMRNPYYRYHLAYKAFLAQDYESAIEHLEYSVKKRSDEDAFYFLMGLSHLKNGDESEARQWLDKAIRIADDKGLKRNYHSKLESLYSSH